MRGGCTMYRISKQTMSIGLSFALALSSLGMPFSIHSAAKAKLTKTKLTMNVGQKKKITIKRKKKKAKYSFSSSSAKKASVSKKGVVTAKKKGTVKITVKEKYKKKTRKVGTVTVTIKNAKAGTPITTPNVTDAPAPTNTVAAPTNTPAATPTASPSATPTRTPKITPTPYPEDSTYSNLPSGFMNKNESVAGTIKELYYNSTVVAEGKTVERHARVALPKDYTKTKKYPVIYMQHGIFGNEYSLTGDNTQYVAWNAIANGDMKEAIVVFANVCANEEGKGNGFNKEHYEAYDNFINDLTECLMPAVNEKYSTLTGRENTAVCGFSMGGRVSLQIGFQRPDLFAYVGAFCPAPGMLPYTMNGVTEEGFFKPDTFTLPADYLNNTYVQITKGVKDTVVQQHPQLYHEALTNTNTPHAYYETMGGDPTGTGSGNHARDVYQHGYYNFMKRIFR